MLVAIVFFMKYRILDLSLFSADELQIFFSFVEHKKNQHLADSLKLDIVRGNVFVRFVGDALLESNKYALFYRSMVQINKESQKEQKDYLLTLRLCSGSLSSNHLDLINRIGIPRLIVAGTTKQRAKEFDSYSSHWNKIVGKDTPWHRMGVKVNDLLLKNYGIKKGFHIF